MFTKSSRLLTSVEHPRRNLHQRIRDLNSYAFLRVIQSLHQLWQSGRRNVSESSEANRPPHAQGRFCREQASLKRWDTNIPLQAQPAEHIRGTHTQLMVVERPNQHFDRRPCIRPEIAHLTNSPHGLPVKTETLVGRHNHERRQSTKSRIPQTSNSRPSSPLVAARCHLDQIRHGRTTLLTQNSKPFERSATPELAPIDCLQKPIPAEPPQPISVGQSKSLLPRPGLPLVLPDPPQQKRQSVRPDLAHRHGRLSRNCLWRSKWHRLRSPQPVRQAPPIVHRLPLPRPDQSTNQRQNPARHHQNAPSPFHT